MKNSPMKSKGNNASKDSKAEEKKSYRIELKRENKGVCLQGEDVKMATSGLELIIRGLGDKLNASNKLVARVHTVGHHSKR